MLALAGEHLVCELCWNLEKMWLANGYRVVKQRVAVMVEHMTLSVVPM